VIPYWSKSTEKALAELQAAKKEQLAEHEAAVQRLIAEGHRGDDEVLAGDVESGVWIDTGSGPGYVYYPEQEARRSAALEFLSGQIAWMRALAARPGPEVELLRPGVWLVRKDPNNSWSVSGS
jgi:hypothetical protein